MNQIKILDAHLSNMIAAGEVVERPGSVIKELIENAIDANASRIEIEIEHAGRVLIEVRDNGKGMTQEDLSLCILRHATSKIRDEYDLFRIKTLGFRGEALPSIASVSQFTIASYSGIGSGSQLRIIDGQTTIHPYQNRQGTVVTVEQLFYNTPARLKFLKNDYIETSHIVDVITRIALGHPHISFQLMVDGKPTFITDGRGEMKNLLTQLFGQESVQDMIPFSTQTHDVLIQGFLGLPSLAKSHRYSMYTLVNGRSVHLPKINQAILEAYRPYLPPIRFPWVFLHFHVDPSLVDVNVHPTKKEVRLSKEDALKSALIPAIRTALQTYSLAPLADVGQGSEIRSSNPIIQESNPRTEYGENDHSMLVFGDEKPHTSLTVIAQLHLTYLVCIDHQGSIYLIDQHAADERIRYEQQLSLLNDKQFAVAPLIPILLELKPSEASLLTEERLLMLKQIGVELAPFGNHSFKVTSLPSWALAEGKLYVEDLLQQMFEEPMMNPDKLRLYAIASKACKTSIKAQDALSLEAMQSLVDRLFKCQYPYTCPHGRPTMIQYAKRQLEAMFKRSGFSS